MSADAEEFFRARDFLLAHGEEHERACRGFRWPALSSAQNWEEGPPVGRRWPR